LTSPINPISSHSAKKDREKQVNRQKGFTDEFNHFLRAGEEAWAGRKARLKPKSNFCLLLEKFIMLDVFLQSLDYNSGVDL